MTNLHPNHPHYTEPALTPIEEAEKARLESLIGKTVTRTGIDGHVSVGTLEAVYVSDGLAVNVLGLVDWAEHGKDYGRDFSMGPLYGDNIQECSPWVGRLDGRIVKVYAGVMPAFFALGRGEVDRIDPWTPET